MAAGSAAWWLHKPKGLPGLLSKGVSKLWPMHGSNPASACTHHELLPVHNIFKWLKKIFNISWHIKIIRNSSISVHKVLLECSHANSLLSMAAFSMHWQRWKGWQGPRWPAKLKTFTTSSFTESLLISVLGHKIKSFLNGSQLSTLVHAY